MRQEAPARSASVPPALPAALRKHQRRLVAELREIATETHVLHRFWYKNHAQLRHMVWWRRVRCVRQLGCRIATGPLRGTVPRAGSTASHTDGAACAPLDSDTPILGTALLTSLAQAYASLWGEEAASWERCASD